MRSAVAFFAFTILLVAVSARIDPKNLKCLVCRTTFEELNDVIKKVDKWKKVDVGNFRMDASGNTMQEKVPAHRSAVYISELIDEIFQICFNHAQYCEEWMLPTEEDTTWTHEMEAEYVKVHGPDPYGFGGLPPQSQMPDVSADYDDEDAQGDDFDIPAEKDEL
ncbi:protein canopy-1 [Spodoptera litura]|uniref:Protein canopy-1 n=1 Tax=Spodoptera litura TaxID=69820 RepID=A0A9J7IJD3_SPOLT|nr:protein canopy-1 [Spodoptera litura]